MTTERCRYIDEAMEITDEQFTILKPQKLMPRTIIITQERCRYCGRTIKQHRRYCAGTATPTCRRCFDNDSRWGVSHAKAVRIAWKYRRLYREHVARRCDDCKHYDFNICTYKRPPGDSWYVPACAQCPRFERNDK